MLVLSFGSCTQNQRAKKLGGTSTLELESNQKLVTATQKSDNLWILTREMKPNETAEVYKFSEESSYGVFQGTYVIKEHKTK